MSRLTKSDIRGEERVINRDSLDYPSLWHQFCYAVCVDPGLYSVAMDLPLDDLTLLFRLHRIMFASKQASSRPYFHGLVCRVGRRHGGSADGCIGGTVLGIPRSCCFEVRVSDVRISSLTLSAVQNRLQVFFQNAFFLFGLAHDAAPTPSVGQ